VYIGDDVTDEDAFKALADRGTGIVVAETDRATSAAYRLGSPAEVEAFLGELASRLGPGGQP
jgi:trehalose 6-phosphate phosphatase